MSRRYNYQENNTYNKRNLISTPRRTKSKIDISSDINNLNQPSKELSNKLSTNNSNNATNKKKTSSNSNEQNQEQQTPKTPKEILSSLLKKYFRKISLKIRIKYKRTIIYD